MERVRMRDVDAFERLYDDFHRLVYGVALRMLGNEPAAEDLTQAVFLQLWGSPERFRGGHFSAWLVRVTRNRALDLLRSKAALPVLELPERPTESDALEESAISNITASHVREALTALPAEQREPIELGFFEGITHEEIARRTGIPLGTVKTRIRAGLRKLRSELDGVVRA